MESDTDKHNFIGYFFPENWDFSGQEFKVGVNFSEATFQDAHFLGATFQDAHFLGATFHKKVELVPMNIEKLDLRYTEFLFRSYITADLTKALFHRCFIENVAFENCKWPDNYIIHEEKHMNDEDIRLWCL